MENAGKYIWTDSGGANSPGRIHDNGRHPRLGSKLVVSDLPPRSVHAPACTLTPKQNPIVHVHY